MLSEVPEGWEKTHLAQLLKQSLFSDGDWVESKDQSPNGDVRLIQLADIGDGYFVNKSDRHLTKETAKRLNCTFLQKGDLLVARMPEPLGRCCRFPINGDERFVTVVDVAVLRPQDIFDADWLMNLINSGYARKHIEDNAGGTTRKRISRKNLGALLLPVPPLSEQKRIAEVLGSVDASIQATRVVIGQAERVKRGLMEELLTGGLGGEAIGRGEVPEGWQKKRLGELFDVKSSKRVVQKQWRKEGVPFYRGREITALSKNGFVDNELFIEPNLYKEFSSKHGVPHCGDILITAIGTIGSTYIVPEGAQFYFKDGSVLWLKSHSNCLSKLVNFWFQSVLFEVQLDVGNGTTVDCLTISKLNSMSIPLPPLNEQKRIAEILSSFDDFIARQKSVIEQQARIKKGLMDDLLTGKVRTV